jgi:hypothetical protein
VKLLLLTNLGNEVYPGSEVETAKLEDGLFCIKDLGTETNDSKGIFGHHRNELWNTDSKNESCGISI